MAEIIPPGRNQEFLDPNGRPNQRITAWAQLVSEQAQTLEGEGSPEGVVEGNLGWEYLDTLGPTFYKKTTNGGVTGWIAI